MNLLKIGNKGPEVIQLQLALKSAGFFQYEADGDFGPQTERAVKAFQKAKGLKADGIVGPGTWQKLPPPKTVSNVVPMTSNKTLAQRCLELTATIETSQNSPHCFAGVSGNFDGMAVSFGALQWNFGQKSLQPMLTELIQKYPQVMNTVFGKNFDLLKNLLMGPHQDLMNYFSGIQTGKKEIWAEWKAQFKNLGYTPECVQAQVQQAKTRYDLALKMCRDYNVVSERAVALMFDIVVQNGSIKSSTREQILQKFKTAKNETEKLLIVAKLRSEAASADWKDDVFTRKSVIAKGFGVIHGKTYDLAAGFGITDAIALDLKDVAVRVA